MKALYKILIAILTFSIVSSLSSCSKDDDDDKNGSSNGDSFTLGGLNTSMSQKGNTFEIVLSDPIDGVDQISVEVVDFQQGVSTIEGSVELTNPLLAGIASIIAERFPGRSTMANNTITFEADVRMTNRGVSDFSTGNEFAMLEYHSASVGDVYTMTANGKTYHREVINKTNDQSYYWEAGDKFIDVIEVESTGHELPDVDKVVYHFNPTYGPVGAKAYFSDGTTKSISIKSGFLNSVVPQMGAPEDAFNPNVNYGELEDIEGNTYKTLQIGTQTWMAENLYTRTFNDGTIIPEAESFANMESPAWYAFYGEYGFYYNMYAAASGKLCPVGWRVPTDEDWKTLAMHLGEIEETNYPQLGRTGFVTDEAIHLASNSELWEIDHDFTNSTGFSILPNGVVFGSTGNNLRTSAYLWSVEFPDFSLFEITQSIMGDGLKPVSAESIDRHGYGVRCIKN